MCIINSSAISSQLAFGVNRCGDRLAILHAHTLENLLCIPVLGEVEAILCAFDVDAKKETERAHVPDGELSSKVIDNGAKESIAGTGEHDVIDIEEKIGNVGATLKDEKRGIGSCGSETELDNRIGEPSVPSTWRLFQSVQGLVEQAHGIRTVSIHKTRWLLA
jgi:hypothetical protein